MRTLIAVLCLTLAGCATTRPAGSPVPAAASRTVQIHTTGSPAEPVATPHDEAAIEAGLSAALDFCLPILSGYEAQAAARARHAYYLRMSGLVAGSVLVPALVAAAPIANAAWIGAAGGWAGATGFASNDLASLGLSGGASAQVRNGIVLDMQKAIAVATDGSLSLAERRAAVFGVHSACVAYSIAVPTVSQ